MTQDDLLDRLYLIYAAVKAPTKLNMAKLPPRVVSDKERIGFLQDFSGNLSAEDRALAVQSVIHNIASLYDHLKRWARANEKDDTRVESTFEGSLDLRIMRDLWDRDKHGGDRRDGGYSRKSPRLANIRRVMKLTTQGRAGSFVTMTMSFGGVPQIAGDGSARAILTADVLDKDGQRLGDLFEIEERCVGAWESLLKRYGVQIPGRNEI